MARHDGGAPLKHWTLACDSPCAMGISVGYFAFLKVPSGAVDDPALAPFLHPARDGSDATVLRGGHGHGVSPCAGPPGGPAGTRERATAKAWDRSTGMYVGGRGWPRRARSSLGSF
jgi:hypothetical protein